MDRVTLKSLFVSSSWHLIQHISLGSGSSNLCNPGKNITFTDKLRIRNCEKAKSRFWPRSARLISQLSCLKRPNQARIPSDRKMYSHVVCCNLCCTHRWRDVAFVVEWMHLEESQAHVSGVAEMLHSGSFQNERAWNRCVLRIKEGVRVERPSLEAEWNNECQIKELQMSWTERQCSKNIGVIY